MLAYVQFGSVAGWHVATTKVFIIEIHSTRFMQYAVLVSELVKPSCSSILFSQNMAASKGSSMSSRTGVFIQLTPYLVAKFKILNFFWHLYAELNLDEIKNALHNLPINRETNLMNLIRS